MINLCNKKKELNLKYELENNVNLVKFENQFIEISFNENLNKNFVKDLSNKLIEWTKKRWIISFSKKSGDYTIKQKKNMKKIEKFELAKKSKMYQKVLETFENAELIDIDGSIDE